MMPSGEIGARSGSSSQSPFAMPDEHDLQEDSGVGKWKDSDGRGGPSTSAAAGVGASVLSGVGAGAGAGPVKAACLSCRQKKAKCDGVKPACGQVS
jgi:hypothetical protein